MSKPQQRPVYSHPDQKRYDTGYGLGLVASAEYPNLASTPRPVVNLALAIHDQAQALTKDYMTSHRQSRPVTTNLFTGTPRMVCVDAYHRLDMWGATSATSIGHSAISLAVGRHGLRFGDHRLSFLPPHNRYERRRFHLSEYRVDDPLRLFLHGGSLLAHSSSDIATRLSLITIDAPASEAEGPINVALYRQDCTDTPAEPGELSTGTLTELQTELIRLTAGF